MTDRSMGAEANRTKSLQELSEEAALKNIEAQYNLGLKYENGEGVPRNNVEAIKCSRRVVRRGACDWFLIAAKQGPTKAKYNLRVIYNNGESLPQEKTDAVKWLRMVAEHGNAEAQYNLGMMYYQGDYVSQDMTEAAKWLRMAAEHVRANAFTNQRARTRL